MSTLDACSMPVEGDDGPEWCDQPAAGDWRSNSGRLYPLCARHGALMATTARWVQTTVHPRS